MFDNKSVFYFGTKGDGTLQAFPMRNVLVEGRTGQGKTTFINQLIINQLTVTTEPTEIFMFSKDDDFKLSNKYHERVKTVKFDITNIDESFEKLRLFMTDVKGMINQRIDSLSKPVLVILDDVRCLAEIDTEWFDQQLSYILKLGRSANVFICICDHGTKWLPSSVKSDIEYNITLSYDSKLRIGIAYIKWESGSSITSVKTRYYSTEMVKKIHKLFSVKKIKRPTLVTETDISI